MVYPLITPTASPGTASDCSRWEILKQQFGFVWRYRIPKSSKSISYLLNFSSFSGKNKVSQRTQKARRYTARLCEKILWGGQLCSAPNQREIIFETAYALMVSSGVNSPQYAASATSTFSNRSFRSYNSLHPIFVVTIYIGVKVPGAENTFERDRVDGADPRKKFGPNLSKKSKSDKLE